MPAALGIFLTKVLAALMAFISVAVNPFAASRQLPAAPDDFKPVLRFAVASDVHIQVDDQTDDSQPERIRLAQFINKAYELAESSNTGYKKLDAICFAGDMANQGLDEEAEIYINICKANLRPGTQLLNVLGNHDQFKGADTALTRFEKIFDAPLNYNVVINGFHLIGVSYSTQKDYKADGVKTWLDTQIKEAVAEDKTKPVFVFQHPHPFATVYGSVNWGDFTTATVYNKYSQVVVFSGHSHYPMNDPRSLWQGSYTSIGTASLSYFEMEKDMFAGQFPDGYEQAAQFRLVEVDAQGNTRVRSFDLITDSFFGLDYYLTDFNKKSKFTYTSRNMMKLDKNPAFDNGAAVDASVNDEGKVCLDFPAAQDNFIVHDYKVTVTNRFGLPVWSGSVMSHYYLINYGDAEHLCLDEFTPKAGSYKVTVRAQNAYGGVSRAITGELTVG